ncbi:ISWI chromatin-remodeling complex ATPase HuISW1 [Hanseniaspora uvarum DSM 2768]|nr:hypothetical protein FOG48_03246 [Hanseniaspora uvarum]KKA02228.1 ISWI chromatin-remodeling complex ATPase HuISW1 [Hanseniaspora uvarum DSM 2768]
MVELDVYFNKIKALKDNLPENFDSTDHYLIEKSQLKSSGNSQQTLDFNSTLKRFIKLLEITPLFKRFLVEKVAQEKTSKKINANHSEHLLFTKVYEYIEKKYPNLLIEDGTTKNSDSKGTAHRNKLSEKEEDKLLINDEDNEIEDEKTETLEKEPVLQFSESPIYVNGELRPYQIQGLNWMIELFNNNLSGILADEMGLGKTLQTVSFLGYLRYFKQKKGPFLIITPKSTLNNWKREFNMWTPEVNCFVLQGDKQERSDIVNQKLLTKDFDVVVASYETVIIEKMQFKKFDWEYVVIDEAHRIKNEQSLLSQVIREIKSKNRMLITGTPLQNNLHELWALLNFLLPDIFTSAETFDEWFGKTKADEEKAESEEKDSDLVVKQLHSILTPFLLRRVKQDVEHSLKPKVELTVYTGLSAMQKKWYRQILEKDIDSINGNNKGSESKTQLLNIMMQLRKCCNHPYLFDGAEPGPPFTLDQHLIDNSAKLKVLDQLLAKFKRDGSRVLIFSQMSRVLDILEDYCYFKEYEYCRIDGSTDHEDRIKAIDDYNSPDSKKFVFLLTTRAGGLGINLTTADVVVLFDSDWNPQADLQAMDRAHRIGQKKQVKVFRFITEKTVEEKILERAKQKLRLDQLVIQQGRMKEAEDKKKTNSKDELLSMIQHGAKELFEQNKNSDGSDKDDEFDLEKLLRESEQRTKELNEKYESLTLDDIQNVKTEAGSTYEWDGQSFKKKATSYNLIDASELIKQQQLQSRRDRQTNYNVDQYYSNALNGRSTANIKPQKKLKMEKPEYLPLHHFYPERTRKLSEKKRLYETKINEIVPTMDDCKLTYELTSEDWDDGDEEFKKKSLNLLKESIKKAKKLTERESSELDELRAQGFTNWTKLEFRKLITALQRHGRQNMDAVASELKQTKTLEEVEKYFDVFWANIHLVDNYEKIVSNIELEEQKIKKLYKQQEALRIKVSAYHDPLKDLVIKYPSSASLSKRTFSEEQDKFLVVMLLKYGVFDGKAYDKIKQDINKSPMFFTDFVFKNKHSMDIQRRCGTLLQYIEKENLNIQKDKAFKSKLKEDEELYGAIEPSKKKVKKTIIKE